MPSQVLFRRGCGYLRMRKSAIRCICDAGRSGDAEIKTLPAIRTSPSVFCLTPSRYTDTFIDYQGGTLEAAGDSRSLGGALYPRGCGRTLWWLGWSTLSRGNWRKNSSTSSLLNLDRNRAHPFHEVLGGNRIRAKEKGRPRRGVCRNSGSPNTTGARVLAEGRWRRRKELATAILLAAHNPPPTPEEECTSLCITVRSDRSYLDSVWAGAAGAAGAA